MLMPMLEDEDLELKQSSGEERGTQIKKIIQRSCQKALVANWTSGTEGEVL